MPTDTDDLVDEIIAYAQSPEGKAEKAERVDRATRIPDIQVGKARTRLLGNWLPSMPAPRTPKAGCRRAAASSPPCALGRCPARRPASPAGDTSG